jgi:aerobic carbon-monoxide dehydrogenase small subunit
MSNEVKVEITLNGEARTVNVSPKALLVDTLRNSLDKKGTRIGCLTGDCGACTVILNGQATKSCLKLAGQANHADVTTIEGLHDATLLQAAFVECKAFQCGYCTSGMVVVAWDFMRRNRHATRDEIRRAISGNLCRCTGYDSIVDAIEVAFKRRPDGLRET